MKPASEIHAEVGKQISIADSGKYRAFTVSDIAKIIADAILYSAGEVDKLAAHFIGNVKTDGTRDASVYEQGIGCERAGQMLREIAKLNGAKAESKGVCEWKPFKVKTMWNTSACGHEFYFDLDFKHCPGCGKEIKVV